MNKLSLPSTVIIIILIIGAAYLLSQLINKRSLEKQFRKDSKEVMIQNNAQLLENQNQCREIGEKIYEKIKTSHFATWNPNYKYNQKLNTCLVSLTKHYETPSNPDNEGVNWQNLVIDAYTNETILEYFHYSDKERENTELKYEEWKQKHDELMQN